MPASIFIFSPPMAPMSPKYLIQCQHLWNFLCLSALSLVLPSTRFGKISRQQINISTNILVKYYNAYLTLTIFFHGSLCLCVIFIFRHSLLFFLCCCFFFLFELSHQNDCGGRIVPKLQKLPRYRGKSREYLVQV